MTCAATQPRSIRWRQSIKFRPCRIPSGDRNVSQVRPEFRRTICPMLNPQGKWCIYDPRLPGFIAEYSTLLEAQSWLQMTQGPDTELTVVFVPDGAGG